MFGLGRLFVLHPHSFRRSDWITVLNPLKWQNYNVSGRLISDTSRGNGGPVESRAAMRPRTPHQRCADKLEFQAD